jgi:hypothetical protein
MEKESNRQTGTQRDREGKDGGEMDRKRFDGLTDEQTNEQTDRQRGFQTNRRR